MPHSFPTRLSSDLAWEILENSPIISDRYREVTMAYGYSGDSVLNSVSDAGFMVLGFLAAGRMRWWHTVLLALVFDLLTLFTIRDNLKLNVLMLVSTVEAIKDLEASQAFQGPAGGRSPRSGVRGGGTCAMPWP